MLIIEFYLENRVQSNTFSVSYANFLQENYHFFAQVRHVCAILQKVFCHFYTHHVFFIKKGPFRWSFEKDSVALQNNSF